MKIAKIAPLAESVPLKLYGGTEHIVSYLTERHDVTLFASVDSVTDAGLCRARSGFAARRCQMRRCALT